MLTGLVLWPIVTGLAYIRFTVASVIMIIPFTLHCLFGSKPLVTDFENLYGFLNRIPLGKYFFGGLVGGFTPGNALFLSKVNKLSGGVCEATQRDWPWTRNPFGSLHACALIFLGEFTSGIAVVAAMQRAKHVKGIPTSINTKYHSKVKDWGLAHARAVVKVDDITEKCTRGFTTEIRNGKGELCCEVTVNWDFIVKDLDQKKSK